LFATLKFIKVYVEEGVLRKSLLNTSPRMA
jgi:hypothetical protein